MPMHAVHYISKAAVLLANQRLVEPSLSAAEQQAVQINGPWSLQHGILTSWPPLSNTA